MEQKLAIKLRNNQLCPISSKNEGTIKVGADVVVKTNRGEEFGKIISFPKSYPQKISKEVQLRKVIRYATEQDIKKANSLPQIEKNGVETAAAKIREFELPIKIISVEYLFDTSKVFFYYKVPKDKKMPDSRDFRKNLSGTLKAEVTLRLLSARDEAKFVGGLGPCGRKLCCSGWLTKPKHITVKMVKEQGFQISPTRTSGMCGRLMCCFGYETENKKGKTVKSSRRPKK
ncbi:MAG: hypothetical protein HQ564_08750 [Candidatus Saganbacteria bacterium]|nr:hypothetical protein [Candidatus Saganbacteria bacterium]